MKINTVLLLFLTLITFYSCSVDKCDVDCVSGPLSLNFQLLDKNTGENLFTNETFNSEDIQVLDLDNDNNNVQFTFYDEDSIDLINLGPFGWGINKVNYILKVGDRDIFTLELDAEQRTEDCCSYVAVTKLEIKNSEYQLNPETGIYEILVQL